MAISPDAERTLYDQRDQLLRWLTTLSPGSSTFLADFSPGSLKDLERWYLELLEGAGFGSLRTDPETFQRAIAMYMGEVLVRNAPPFEWFVTEYAFEAGRYEIGVRRPLYAVMLTRLSPAPRSRNKRGQSLWREYRQHARQQVT